MRTKTILLILLLCSGVMSGFGGIGAISSVQDIISITRTVRAAMVSLSVSLPRGRKA
jgi:hypothetical protein